MEKSYPRDHGYPLRVVLPGVVGARSVKWLKTIKASKTESPSFFQKKDYRTTPPSADWNTFDFYGIWGPCHLFQSSSVSHLQPSWEYHHRCRWQSHHSSWVCFQWRWKWHPQGWYICRWGWNMAISWAAARNQTAIPQELGLGLCGRQRFPYQLIFLNLEASAYAVKPRTRFTMFNQRIYRGYGISEVSWTIHGTKSILMLKAMNRWTSQDDNFYLPRTRVR